VRLEAHRLFRVPLAVVPVIDSLKRARARYRSDAALGEAIGVGHQQIGRALKGKRGISAEVTLRLAVTNDEMDRALVLLEEAGHREMADLLRQVYGEPGQEPLTAKEREFLKLLKEVEREDRARLEGLVRSLAKKRR
jgi:hypothetical protein